MDEASCTTTTDSNHQTREQILLDRFPLLNDEELNVLLSAYKVYNNQKERPNGMHVMFPTRFSTIQDEEIMIIPEIYMIFQNAIETVFVTNTGQHDQDEELLYKFLEASISLCGRKGSDRFILQTLQNITTSSIELASIIYHFALYYVVSCNDDNNNNNNGGGGGNNNNENNNNNKTFLYKNEQPPETWIKIFQRMSSKNDDGNNKNDDNISTLSFAEFNDWIISTFPSLTQLIATVFNNILFGDIIISQRQQMSSNFQLPILDTNTSAFWNNSYNKNNNNNNDMTTIIIPIQLALMDLGGQWRNIYKSDESGLSFHTFQNALCSFHGSTLILIRTTNNECIGYYTDVPWKTNTTSSTKWFTGDGDSFLFSLYPNWNIYHPIFNNGVLPKKYHQYLNMSTTSHRKNDGLQGLAVGGISADAPRLHITTSLEHCKAGTFDVVFENGPLLDDFDNDNTGSLFFDVDTIEVWAVRISNEDIYKHNIEVGKQQLLMKEQLRQNVAKVDRKEFVDDFANGTFVSTLYEHRTQARGRAEFVAANNEGLGYYIEDFKPSSEKSFDINDNVC